MSLYAKLIVLSSIPSYFPNLAFISDSDCNFEFLNRDEAVDD